MDQQEEQMLKWSKYTIFTALCSFLPLIINHYKVWINSFQFTTEWFHKFWLSCNPWPWMKVKVIQGILTMCSMVLWRHWLAWMGLFFLCISWDLCLAQEWKPCNCFSPWRCCCWFLNVPATCACISGTDQLRQFYVLPHWDRSCRSNFPSHPVTVYWHRANQSQRWPYNTRRLAG